MTPFLLASIFWHFSDFLPTGSLVVLESGLFIAKFMRDFASSRPNHRKLPSARLAERKQCIRTSLISISAVNEELSCRGILVCQNQSPNHKPPIPKAPSIFHLLDRPYPAYSASTILSIDRKLSFNLYTSSTGGLAGSPAVLLK